MQKEIIVCRNCHTSFYVDANAVYSTGRFVRCSLCEYEWLVDWNDLQNRSVPSQKKKSLPYSLILAITLIAMLIGALYFGFLQQYVRPLVDRSLEPLRSIAQMIKLQNDIVVKSVSYSVKDELQQSNWKLNKAMFVLVEIENKGDFAALIKTIQIVELDSERLQIGQRSVDLRAVVQPHNVLKTEVKLPLSESAPAYLRVLLDSVAYDAKS